MKKKTYFFENNKPFQPPLDVALNQQKKRVHENKPSLILIDGASGQGKTTMAEHVLEHIQGKDIDLKVQLGNGGEEFQRKLSECFNQGYKVIIYDEAGDFNRRGAISRFNQMINRVFDTYRAYQIIVIMCLPNFNVLDATIFDKAIPRLLINCYGRNNQYGRYRVYSLYRMFYLKQKMEKLTVPQHAYTQVEPNFRGLFKDLTPDKSKAMSDLSLSAKRDILNENIVQSDGLVTYKDIAKEYNVSAKYISILMNKKKIKPAAVIGLKKYYHPKVVDELDL